MTHNERRETQAVLTEIPFDLSATNAHSFHLQQSLARPRLRYFPLLNRHVARAMPHKNFHGTTFRVLISWRLCIRCGAVPSPAGLRSDAVVEPLEERGRGGCCAVATGVEREKHPCERAGYLCGQVTC